MPLVDLRGRETEPAVAVLLGSDDGSGVPIGWDDGRSVVGYLRVNRESQDEIRLGPLVVQRPSEREDVGMALIESLARVANAGRLVADAAQSDVAWLERCGFSVAGAQPDGRIRCVRALPAVPGPPETVAAFSLTELERAIADSWSRETSDDPDEWSQANPARGQCDVTALVVRDLLGGEILIANVLRDGKRVERHAWNRLPTGVTIDLTRGQFLKGETFDAPEVQEPQNLSRSPERYELLSKRVRAALDLAPEP